MVLILICITIEGRTFPDSQPVSHCRSMLAPQKYMCPLQSHVFDYLLSRGWGQSILTGHSTVAGRK